MAAGENALDLWGQVQSLQASGGFVSPISAATAPWTGTDEDEIHTGSDDDDVLDGRGGNDQLSGDAGNDTLIGGLGADYLEGGIDFDFVSYTDATAGIIANLWRSILNTGEAAGDSYVSIEGIIGSAFNDWLTGGLDRDHLIGGAGDDRLEGGAGIDTLEGGAGNDVYIDPLGDKIIDISGIDTILTSRSYALPGDTIENLAVLDANGTSDVALSGNGLDNTLTGNSGANRIDGIGGADTLIGGSGNDTYVVDQKGDKVVEGTGGGVDVVIASSSYILDLNAEVEVLMAADSASKASQNLDGSDVSNTIIGSAGINTLNGYGGKDMISAGAGNDKIYGGSGNDTLHGGAGSDQIYGETGRDVFVFDSKPAKTDIDKIYGYKASDDSICLDNAVFTKLGKGTFAKPVKFKSDMCVESRKAQDREDRIVYDKKTGALYYDQDGTGSKAQVKIATLTNKTKLSYHDFFVV